jgi:hypothetical protein
MTSVPAAPKGTRHLRVFLVSLAILLLGLGVFVFGVSMESTATADGWVTARGLREVRAPGNGLVSLASRNSAGDLSPGDFVKPGVALATLRPPEGVPGRGPVTVAAPATEGLWLVATVDVVPGQAVQAGQKLMTLVPVDEKTRQPRQLLARLEVSEEHIAEVKKDQKVRLSSNLYNERVHGKFSAVVERIDPMAEPGPDGKRRFQVLAVLERSDRPLLLGSGLKAEILLGPKPVYRIILEH